MSKFLFPKELFDELDYSLLSLNLNSDVSSFPEVGPNLILRPLCNDDYNRGFVDVLQQLTDVGSVPRELFLMRFNSMFGCKDTYFVIVIEDTSKSLIVGSATLIVEQKFIHSCSKRGRIEDVVVSREYRKKDLGKILVSTLCSLAEKLLCYKVTLECADSLVPFYKNFGFIKESNNSNYLQKRLQKS